MPQTERDAKSGGRTARALSRAARHRRRGACVAGARRAPNAVWGQRSTAICVRAFLPGGGDRMHVSREPIKSCRATPGSTCPTASTHDCEPPTHSPQSPDQHQPTKTMACFSAPPLLIQCRCRPRALPSISPTILGQVCDAELFHEYLRPLLASEHQVTAVRRASVQFSPPRLR